MARGMTTRGPSVGTRNYKGHCAASSLSVQYVMLPAKLKFPEDGRSIKKFWG